MLYCDEWGGAESRGNGARPVEVIGNERHLHHSPVSSPTGGASEGLMRSDNSGRREIGPGPGF